MSQEEVEPSLLVKLSEPAEAQITEAYQWLWQFGFDVAERWLHGITEAITEEARQTAGPIGFQRPLVIEENPYPDHTVYSFLYRPSRRGTAWKVYYELVDDDQDSTIDTLLVVRVRHASAR